MPPSGELKTKMAIGMVVETVVGTAVETAVVTECGTVISMAVGTSEIEIRQWSVGSRKTLERIGHP